MNKRFDQVLTVAIPLAICALVVTCPTWAGNGFNMIAYGAKSVTMGGADIAVARDTSAVNTNPSGLTRISGGKMDLNKVQSIATSVQSLLSHLFYAPTVPYL